MSDVRAVGAASESRSPFKTVEQLRAFEAIILQVEQAILAGELSPGDRLPAERDLAEMVGFSRASVREAMRVLEAFGVIGARRGTGPDAGSIIKAGAESGMVSALRLHAALLRIPTADLVDIRSVLEGHAVGLAAHVADAEEIARLRTLIEEMGSTSSGDEYLRVDADFHIELARASGNALAPVLMQALRSSVAREMSRTLRVHGDWLEERARLISEHEVIVDLIEAGDADAATRAVREHISRFYRQVAAANE